MRALLLSIHFHDSRYHGGGEWPPSPARLFQALVAGSARGEKLDDPAVEALKWLESLDPPAIAAPRISMGQHFVNYVPNNDRDVVEAKRFRGSLASQADYLNALAELRAGKHLHPRIFHASTPLLYLWTFSRGADAERHARAICQMADNLYQLGRGVDMAWATGTVSDERDAHCRLNAPEAALWRPNEGGLGAILSCPRPGSWASLAKRFQENRQRFQNVEIGRTIRRLFVQATKPEFRPVPYDSPSLFLLYEIRNARGFAPQPLENAAALTESIRDLAVRRLKASPWRQNDPKREALADKVFIGRDSREADKARRVRIIPLPSIGHAQTERSIRRVLIVVPPDCPIAAGDLEWAFSGLDLGDPGTGEAEDDAAELVKASDERMLAHYGIKDRARLWRTVTPAALPEPAAGERSRHIRMRKAAGTGAERRYKEERAADAVRFALHHAGIDAPVEAIRVQREPFESHGLRAEAFARGTRFAKRRLWHVEVAFWRPIAGPLTIGDGRYLGLGLMAPVFGADGILAYAIASGLSELAEPLGLARALRRAVLARVQEALGTPAQLPPFFTGHAADGTPARSGRHEHLAFVSDPPRKRLLVVAPHVLEHREASAAERENLRRLKEALEGFQELRAGAGGRLALLPSPLDRSDDPLLAPSRDWENLTPYRVTRHARGTDAARALEADLLLECQRAGLPRPRIDVIKTFARPNIGLFGFAKLQFRVATAGPIVLGRDRHFGGGLFVRAGSWS